MTPGGGAQLPEVGAAVLELPELPDVAADVEVRVARAPGAPEPVPARVSVNDVYSGGIFPVQPITRR